MTRKKKPKVLRLGKKQKITSKITTKLKVKQSYVFREIANTPKY
tara:strand:- start:822 stop:953 length:132 start_codon:yes stop_codon:yes gene_type:complete